MDRRAHMVLFCPWSKMYAIWWDTSSHLLIHSLSVNPFPYSDLQLSKAHSFSLILFVPAYLRFPVSLQTRSPYTIVPVSLTSASDHGLLLRLVLHHYSSRPVPDCDVVSWQISAFYVPICFILCDNDLPFLFLRWEIMEFPWSPNAACVLSHPRRRVLFCSPGKWGKHFKNHPLLRKNSAWQSKCGWEDK